MTVPVTGPFSKTITLNGPPNSLGGKPVHLSIARKWYRQKKPYNLPLAYELDLRRIRDYQSFDPTTIKDVSTGVWYGGSVWSSISDPAYNKAYSRFVDQVKGESAQLAVSWLERQKTLQMMATRLIQLRKFVRAVRHFQIDEAWKIAGGNRSRSRSMSLPEWRTMANRAGGAYLEFHFGWEPTIKEVMRCVDLLSGDWPKARIKAKASNRASRVETSSSGFSFQRVEFFDAVAWRLAAEIRISNPNLLLADQVGLVNPLLVVHEIIPFSFLADWVSNLSDYLQSFYPFVGVELVNPHRTLFSTSRQYHILPNNPSRERWWADNVIVNRMTGPFPGPTLRLKAPKALSVTRAATAASLLLQLVKRGKPPW